MVRPQFHLAGCVEMHCEVNRNIAKLACLFINQVVGHKARLQRQATGHLKSVSGPCLGRGPGFGHVWIRGMFQGSQLVKKKAGNTNTEGSVPSMAINLASWLAGGTFV